MSDLSNTQKSTKKNVTAKVSRLLKQANTLAERGMYDDAIVNIRMAEEINPDDPRCSVQLVDAYRAQNKMRPAIEAMKRVVELDPTNSTMQEQLLHMLIELGRYDEAINISRKQLKRAPKDLYVRDVLGIAYLQQGKIDKALQITNELIRLAPTDAAHHFKKAVLLQQKGEISHAMVTFTRALDMDPDGEMANDAREAIAALDSYQLRQILTIALEDAIFRTKLTLDPESASQERGFLLSSSGISTLRQIDLDSLPGDAQNRYYH